MIKIYIIEDDTDDQHFMIEGLKTLIPDCYVRTFTEAEKCFEALHNYGRPNFIITDLNLPKMNGHQIITELKKASYKDVPVFVLTSSTREYDKQTSLSVGALEHYTKPVKMDDYSIVFSDMINRVFVASKPI